MDAVWIVDLAHIFIILLFFLLLAFFPVVISHEAPEIRVYLCTA